MILILSLNPDIGFYQFDTKVYTSIADTLVDYGIFGYQYEGEIYAIHGRVPGYPLFIACFQSIGLGIVSAIIVQLLLGTLNVLLTYQIARTLFSNNKFAIIAGAMMALHIPSIVFTNLIMSETLFTSFFLLGVLYWIKYLIKERQLRSLVFGTIFIGLSIYIRPIPLYFFAFLMVALIIFFRSMNISWKPMLVMVGVSGLTLLPWQYRNYQKYGNFFFTTMPGYFALEGRAAELYAKENDISIYDAAKNLRKQAEEKFEGNLMKQPYEFSELERNMGTAIVLNNPIQYIQNHAKAVLRLLFHPARSTINLQFGAQQDNLITYVLIGFQLIFMFFVLVGIMFGLKPLWSEYRVGFIFLTSIVFYFCLFSAGAETDSRFSVPLFPVLAVLASFGLNKLTCIVKQ